MGHGDLGNEELNKRTPTLLRMCSVSQGQAVGFSGSPFLIWKMRREPPNLLPGYLEVPVRTSGTTLCTQRLCKPPGFSSLKSRDLPQDSPEKTCGPPHLHVSVAVHSLLSGSLPCPQLNFKLREGRDAALFICHCAPSNEI